MKLEKVLNEAPLYMDSDSLKKWNVEQMKVWEKVKEKYSFMEFTKKFDELFSKSFSKSHEFPSLNSMISKF